MTENLKYPQDAIDNDIAGKVLVQFIVNKDGSISDVKTLAGIGYGCNVESERIMNLSKNWNPGLTDGNPVKTKMIFPILFKLSK